MPFRLAILVLIAAAAGCGGPRSMPWRIDADAVAASSPEAFAESGIELHLDLPPDSTEISYLRVTDGYYANSALRFRVPPEMVDRACNQIIDGYNASVSSETLQVTKPGPIPAERNPRKYVVRQFREDVSRTGTKVPSWFDPEGIVDAQVWSLDGPSFAPRVLVDPTSGIVYCLRSSD